MWFRQRPRSPDCILNISEYKLTFEEKNCLYRGLKFHILPKKIDSDNVKIQVESLVKRCFNEKENLPHNLKFELNGITRNFINRAKQISNQILIFFKCRRCTLN